VELLGGPMVMNVVNKKDKRHRGRWNKGEDKDMIQRAVQIKRKFDVKGQKGPISSEGVKTKRRGEMVTYRPCSLLSLCPYFEGFLNSCAVSTVVVQ
jgi:hypothetical protein